MSHLLEYLVPGIADGSIYAICAIGLVLTFKTSGVFNFAHGAIAAAGAYAFYQFRILNGFPWPVAALLALLIVGLGGGLILERIASWLSNAPTVMQVVATVGVLVLLQSLVTAIYGDSNILFRAYLPTSGFNVGHVVISGGDMIIAGLSLGATIGLYYFFKRARLGVAMTAVVDDPNLLSLQGVNPSSVRRIAWVVGSSFAGISGMLLAPQLGVSVNDLILLVITAYGAAAIGLFNNLPLTFLGGILIGIGVDVLPDFLQHIHNVTIQQIPNNLPFLVLFAVLVFVPARKLPQRAVRSVRRFRPIREFTHRVMGSAMALAFVGLLILPFAINQAHVDQYSAALGYAIIFASLGLITWTSGQISLCHLAFAALGAATCGHALAAGVPWVFALLLGGLVTVPAGAIVSIPANRLSGIYVAIATFGFGILIQQIFYPSFLMFGVLNTVSVPRPHMFGLNFTSDRGYYYLAFIVTVLACAVVLAVRRSRLGRLLRALSDSPDALDAHGANTKQTRVLVFCIAAFLAGIGGAVLAGVPQSASGSTGGTFDFTVSLVFVAILAFCGRRPLLSPFLAAFLYEVIKIFPFFDNQTVIKYQGVAFGFLAILVAVAPGIASVRVGKRAAERTRPGTRLDRFVVPSKRAIQPVKITRKAVVMPGPLANGSAVPGDMVDVLGWWRPMSTVSVDLDIRDVTVRFGGVVAVNETSLHARGGVITGLIGPNGAGKTTLFNVCSGRVNATHGTVHLGEQRLDHHGSANRAHRGLGRTFQRMELFESMTVSENVRMGPEAMFSSRRLFGQLLCSRREARESRELAADALERCGITDLAPQVVGDLSTGQRRLVELARVIATPFTFVLLDEPSSGLDVEETEKFGQVLLEYVSDRTIGILLVEHDMSLVAGICQEIHVLDFGRLIYSGPTSDALGNPIVKAAYLGEGAGV